ncbi:MAG: hypothetical protein R3F17_04465 [Planctomycetota bacterium]
METAETAVCRGLSQTQESASGYCGNNNQQRIRIGRNDGRSEPAGNQIFGSDQFNESLEPAALTTGLKAGDDASSGSSSTYGSTRAPRR